MKKLKEAVIFNLEQAKADPLFNKALLCGLISTISLFITIFITSLVAINDIIISTNNYQKRINDLEQLNTSEKEVE